MSNQKRRKPNQKRRKRLVQERLEKRIRKERLEKEERERLEREKQEQLKREEQERRIRAELDALSVEIVENYVLRKGKFDYSIDADDVSIDCIYIPEKVNRVDKDAFPWDWLDKGDIAISTKIVIQKYGVAWTFPLEYRSDPVNDAFYCDCHPGYSRHDPDSVIPQELIDSYREDAWENLHNDFQEFVEAFYQTDFSNLIWGSTSYGVIHTPAQQLFQILITGAEKDTKAHDYLEKNFYKVLHTLIDENDAEYIEKLLATDLMQKKRINDKDIDSMIECAVEHTNKTGNAEIQLRIMRHISQQFDGTDLTRFKL